jgi:hypothetical protein
MCLWGILEHRYNEVRRRMWGILALGWILHEHYRKVIMNEAR